MVRETTSWGTNHVYQKKGWLQAVHHIIYNIVRDKPLDYGFVPITNKSKIISFGGNPNYAFDHAEYQFRRFQQGDYLDDYIMAPFGGMFSKSKLKEWKPKHR